jgi:hypothetical protein
VLNGARVSREDELYPCVGVCIADADETYCLGCGRPWGQAVVATTPPPAPLSPPDEPPPA